MNQNERLRLYEDKLVSLGLQSNDATYYPGGRTKPDYVALRHVLSMVPELRGFLIDGKQQSKIDHWFGFAQGILWAYGIYTLKELKEHNRT